MIGTSLVASIALVAGLTLSLLSFDTPADPTAAPPASEHTGAVPVPDSHDNPAASADQPAAEAAVNHNPARGPVTLLADRTATAPGIPAQLPAPTQPAGVAGPALRVESPAGNSGQRRAGTGYPGPGQEAGPPAPPIRPDPQSEYEREQLARLAKLLAQLSSSQGGATIPGGSVFPQGGGAGLPQHGPTPNSTPSAPKNVPASPGGSPATFGGTSYAGSASVNHSTGPVSSSRSGNLGGSKGLGGSSLGGSVSGRTGASGVSSSSARGGSRGSSSSSGSSSGHASTK